MRDILLFLAVFGALPFVVRAPAVGVLLYTWLSLMNPHRLAYGAAYDFPFAATVAGVTLLALLFDERRHRLPANAVTLLMGVFALWMCLTTVYSLQPQLSLDEWGRVMKSFFMAFVVMYALQRAQDVRALAWVLGLSLAFYGVKGGLFTILSGGSNRVLGPDASYITDNNALALALVMTLPILWYLQMQCTRRWLRAALVGAALLTAIAAAGSYSRGALLAGAAMLLFAWFKSRHKVITALGLAALCALIWLLMPGQWLERMASISEYSQDSSALGRINAWHFAMNLASNFFLGGGFNAFSRQLFYEYAPDPLNYHVAHSIYFQVLGEHGAIGLLLFVLLMGFAWRAASRVIRAARQQEELHWAASLAAAVQMSLVGYFVGGAFLSLAYYDLAYYLIALVVVLDKVVKDYVQTPVAQPAGRVAPVVPSPLTAA